MDLIDLVAGGDAIEIGVLSGFEHSLAAIAQAQ
jgi:hypothetical protein